VQEAWDNYKGAQEKAAAVESELQDEIRQLQKAKQLDKQQLVAQLTKSNEDVAEAVRQVQAAQAQRAEVQARLDAALEENAQWEERLQSVQQELADAKMGTVQGVAALREELRQMQVNSEQMRADHSALVRQYQHRQAELERENAELVLSVTKQEKELQSLRHHASANPGGLGPVMSSENRDYYALQEEVAVLSRSIEIERDKCEELERKLKVTEREARAAQMNTEEERRRSAATIETLSAKIAELEGKLNARKLQPASGISMLMTASNAEGGEKVDEAGAAVGGAVSPLKAVQSGFTLQDYEQVARELQEHRAQSQNLSKLLLKKQGAVLELQAERSALKSRLIDMQARCVTYTFRLRGK
jgi:predicted  nucleic acid-binding Zn-ribbon protein